MGTRGKPLEGALKLLTLALRIAVAWTLLSLLFTAFWALLLEVGRRFPSRPPSKPPVWEERPLSDQLRAVVQEDLCDRAYVEALVLHRELESAESTEKVHRASNL
jgi:hypothetical protein